MVTLARRANRVPFAPVVAVLFGVVAAILMAAVPQAMFERLVVASGLPTLIAAAAPPLGMMARVLAIVAAFLATAGALVVLLRPLGARLEARTRARTPWHDAGYDVPVQPVEGQSAGPRRPIFAPDELGAPLMSDEVVAVVEPERPEVAAEVIADPHHEPLISPAADLSIAALIQRLEDGLARRAANDHEPDPDGGTALDLSAAWIVPDETVAPNDDATDDEGSDVIRQSLWLPQRTAHG